MVLPALRIWKAVRARLAKRVFRRPGNRSRFYRPLLEALEERWVLSTITVLNNLDSGAGSLRDAIDNLAVSGDTIDFAAGLAGQTITLTSGELAINKNLIITGLGANLLSISGSHASRIFDISSDVSISGLTLTAGQATNANGGAISVSGGPLTITDCAFTDNTADANGGAIDSAGVTPLTVSGSTFDHNTSNAGGILGGGGALSIGTGTVDLTNCTFTANTAAVGHGGAINSNFGATFTLVNCTVAGNSASDGGGIRTRTGTGAILNLANTIVAGNSAASGPDVTGTIISQDYNLIQNTSGASFTGTTTHNITGLDPLLGPLANNGGPTQTMALLPGSPAINAGNSAAAPATDQRGFSRDAQPDIGAFEVSHLIVVTTTADEDNGSADPAAGVGTSLREAINLANSAPGADTITFDPTVFATPQTITLTSGELDVTDSLTITGPGADQLAVSGNNASRVFFVAAGTVTISGLTITGGQTPGNGGGIQVGAGSIVTISDSTISNNSAGFSGGGLRNDGGSVTVIDSTISGNTAPFSAGISNNNGPLTLINTTVSGNSATGTGIPTAGGLGNYTFDTGVVPPVDAPVNLINCTFSGNTTADNRSADDLASVQQPGGGAATISLVNTILASSAATSRPNVVTDADTAGSATIVSLGHNLSSDDGNGNLTAASDQLNTDPLLGPLGNYRGPTQTVPLLPGSPALDAGDDTAAPATDQRGVTRPQGAASDIGAFEAQAYVLTSGGSGQSTIVGTAFVSPLQVGVFEGPNPLPGVSVTFTAPSSGPGGSFSGGGATFTGTTDALGQVTAPTFTANTTAGTYTVHAAVQPSSAGLPDILFTLTNNADAATHFVVSAPGSATAGSAFSLTVTALDQFGNADTNYEGTVQFSSTDGLAVLPADSSLNEGTGDFFVTLKTAGSQTITATDSMISSITGTSNTIAVSADAATHFAVSAPLSPTAGVAFSLTVTALDQFGNIDTGYTGTVSFASSDPLALLPGPYTFQPSDLGSHLFTVTLITAGSQSLTVTDGVSAGRLEVAIKPVPIIQGAATIQAGLPYTLSLSTTPLGDVVITGWTIVWGDGTSTTVADNPSTVTHVFTDAPNREEISATASTSLFGAIPAANIVSPLVLIPKLEAAAGVLVNPGETATLDLPGAFGLTATLVRSPTGTQRIKLFIGLYNENPTTTPVANALFYEVRVTTAQPGDRLTVIFRFPPGSSAGGLLFFDPTTGSFRPVQGSRLVANSLRVDPIRGQITVVFDQTSFPTITALSGAVFTVPSVQTSLSQVTIVPPLASADTSTSAFGRSVAFTSTTQVTSTLTTSPSGSPSAGAPASSPGGSDGSESPPPVETGLLELLRRLLRNKVFSMWLQGNKGPAAPAPPSAEQGTTPDEPPSSEPEPQSELDAVWAVFPALASADGWPASEDGADWPGRAAPPAGVLESDDRSDPAWALAVALTGGVAWGVRPHRRPLAERAAATARGASGLQGRPLAAPGRAGWVPGKDWPPTS